MIALLLQAIYKTIDEHKIGTDPSKNLLNNMEKYFSEATIRQSNCGYMKDALLRVPIKTINDMYTDPDR